MARNAGIVIRYGAQHSSRYVDNRLRLKGYSTELHTTQKLASYSRRVFSAMAPSRGPLEDGPSRDVDPPACHICRIQLLQTVVSLTYLGGY